MNARLNETTIHLVSVLKEGSMTMLKMCLHLKKCLLRARLHETRSELKPV